MAITFFWRCESTTLDGTDDYSAGDTTATAVNSPAISATQAYRGTYSVLKGSTVGGGYNFNPSSIFPGNVNSPSTAVGSFGFAMYWDTDVYDTYGSSLFRFRGTDANDMLGIYTAATGTTSAQNIILRTRNATGGLYEITTTGAAITPGNWFRIIGRFDYPNDDLRIEVWNEAGTLVDSEESLTTDLSTYIPAEVANLLVVGTGPTTSGGDAYFDNFIVSDEYNGVTPAMMQYSSYQDFFSTARPPSFGFLGPGSIGQGNGFGIKRF